MDFPYPRERVFPCGPNPKCEEFSCVNHPNNAEGHPRWIRCLRDLSSRAEPFARFAPGGCVGHRRFIAARNSVTRTQADLVNPLALAVFSISFSSEEETLTWSILSRSLAFMIYSCTVVCSTCQERFNGRTLILPMLCLYSHLNQA